MQPLTQTLAALAVTLCAVGWMIRQIEWHDGPPKKPASGFFWSLLILLVLFAWRWPPLFSQVEFNPDESQLAAGAITLTYDPVFWRAVDGTTSGPLNFYVLVPALSLPGLPGIFAVRLTGLLLVWVSLALSFALLRRTLGLPAAFLGMLPAWIFFATTTDGDFVHYSSEHLSLALLSLSAWLLWASKSHQGAPAGWRWLAAGFCTGLLPWAKFQSIPFALALGVGAAASIWLDSSSTRSARARSLAKFGAAATIPTVGFLALALASGQFRDFLQAYVLNNIAYTANPTTVTQALIHLSELTTITWSFPVFLIGSGAVLVGTLLGAISAGAKFGQFFWFSSVIVFAAVACVLVPRLGFPHYLLYLMLPVSWLMAAAIHHCWEMRPSLRGVMVTFVLIFGCLAPVAVRFVKASPVGFIPLEPTEITQADKIAGVVRQFTQPGDTLAIWGWSPRVHLETGLPQATRDGNSFRQIEESTQRDNYYRPRYLSDFARNRPTVFVDAVGPGFFRYFDRPRWGHETFPALSAYVQSEYRLQVDVFGARVYVRRDLITSRSAQLRRAEHELRFLQSRGEVPSPLPNFDLPRRFIYGREVFHMQTPSEATWELFGDEIEFHFSYGFEPEAYLRGTTNGAEIQAELLVPGEEPREVFYRELKPQTALEDRGLFSASVMLPAVAQGTKLRVRTLPGAHNDNAWDWVFLADPRFTRTPQARADAGRPE